MTTVYDVSISVFESFLTVEDFMNLDWDVRRHFELVEGKLVSRTSATPRHAIAAGELFVQLRAQVPGNLRVLQDIDVDLEIALEREFGTVRRPDLIVVYRDSLDRIEQHGGMLCAGDVVLAIEVISPGTHRNDKLHKRCDYADAGIPFYWVIDPERPISAFMCELTPNLDFRDPGEVYGRVQITQPFAATIDLNALR